MSATINVPLTISLEPSPMIERSEKSVEESVASMLDLIVFTPRGSYIADPEFGFEYWNHEFTNVDVREFNNNYMGLLSNSKSLNDISRKQCEESLKHSIMVYEPRLLSPEVKIELGLANKSRKGNKQSKYEMRIIITGCIDEGLGINKQYEKKISFMVEPIAHKISI